MPSARKTGRSPASRAFLCLAVALAGLCAAARAWAEEDPPPGGPGSSAELPAAAAGGGPAPRGAVLSAGVLPDSYGQEGEKRENGLRRFEIIALGSYPIMLFYTNLGFDLSGYIGSGYDPSRAPWPFKNEYSAAVSDSEKLARLGTAALASVLVAGIDAVVREIGHRREERASRRLFEAVPGGPP